MATTTLTRNDILQQLSNIKAAAQMGLFDSVSEMNIWIMHRANLYLWAIEKGTTQDGDMVEAHKFIVELEEKYAGKAGVK